MNRKYIKGAVLLGVTLSIGFTSCQVVNKYKSPEVDSQDLFREENSTDTTTIANIPWNEYFKDPILQSLIEEGLDKNYDLLIASTRIQQAEAGLSMARAAYFPDVALVGQVQQTRTSSDKGKNQDIFGYHSTNIQLGIAATWEADIWGKLNRKSRAAYAQFLGTHAYRNLVQTSLISNIATSYYSLMALDEQLKITKETVELLKVNTETTEAMKEAGLLNGAAVEQTRALLYSTQVTIPDLEMQINQLENNICVLLGRKPGYVARTSIDTQTVPAELEHGIPVQMLAKRPDVQQAELAFRSAFELTNAAQASFYPSITLGTGSMIGYSSSALAGFFRPENLLANIIGGLTQPIFARKQLIGNLRIAKAQQQEALYTFEESVLSASAEVSNIVFSYKASLSKNEIREKQVQALSTSVEFTQELLKAGEANYIEVLNAEQNSLNAQLGQVSDKLEQLQYSVSLYRALGGGIE
ncbi:efflux transporter outer membrane subunit [Dysgonomonas sp. ZJ709]|uniref:efflux transporter outer membrane subunit n=1 Tax=Dysgonomonas sp. ZJ709 TaxID=2709797 RepID=UPI0013EB2B14|nr:efflux transporter outer membrane subunit [Dysgonomonas sp. ZJ709]